MNAADAQGVFDNEKLINIFKDIDLTFTGFNKETLSVLNFEIPEFNYELPTEKQHEVKLSERGLSDEELKKYRKNKRQESDDIQNRYNSELDEKPYMIVYFKDFETKALVCEYFKKEIYQKNFSGEELFKEIL